MEALHDVVRVGKARYIGASAMFAWQFQKALHVAEKHGWTRFVSMQDHLNLISREEEREMLPLCCEEKIRVIPYSPLASGRLTRDWSSESTLRSETDQIAEKHGVPRVHIALAWLLQKKPVTAPKGGRSLDLPGQLASILALGMLTFALIERNSLGIMSPLILAAYTGSVLFFLLLLLREKKTSHPMLPLALFQERTFSATNVVAVCQTFTFTGFLFVMSLFLQQVKHYSPSLTGVALLPSFGSALLATSLSGGFIPRIGAKRVMVIGLLLGDWL